jgi:hypothetical protein
MNITSGDPAASSRLTLTTIALLLGAPALSAQAPPGVPEVRAVAAASGAIRLDGRLEEPVWLTAPAATGFIQREPVEGQAAPEGTSVRFLITGDALVIGARMSSAHPELIRRLVTRRDRSVPSEQLIISLDTRRDRLTAYSFGVTPGAVRTDYFHPSDNEGSQDYSYDPVWQAATAIDGDGWTAELRIPLAQLRYDAGRDQSWGLNIARIVPDRNEESYWVLVGRNETGWSSRMGRLSGLVDLEGGQRLELAPYVALEGTRFGEIDSDDPFAERTSSQFRAGADLKLGLGPSLTLDATINPDFGQVEADPAEVNLSAFETFFDERRPFFVEGSNLLGGRGTFYSRRIGAPPAGSSGARFAEAIGNSTILGAAKVTGRLPSGLSVGTLAAVTGEESVRTFDPDAGFGASIVAPLTGYAIVTGTQEIGRDRSTAKASLTAVQRDLADGSPLAALLVRRAYTGLLDGRWRWAGGRYDISAYAIGSYIEGDSEAILAQQRSSRRYYQRPDADHVALDPGRRSLTGISGGINHSKMAGNLLWDVDYEYASPGLELNDLGFESQVDYHLIAGDVRRRQTIPSSLFHNWNIGVEGTGTWNGAGDRTFVEGGVFGDVTWKNFWTTDLGFEYSPRSLDDRVTRGGPLMQRASEWRAEASVGGPPGAQTRWSAEAGGSRDELGGWELYASAEVRFRPGTRWEVSLEPAVNRGRISRQFIGTRAGGSDATFGGRYLFGEVLRSEVSLQLRTAVAISPDLTLEGYLEPFASSGQYESFGELAAARTLELRRYGSDGTTISQDAGGYTVTDGAAQFSFDNPDFNVRSFRSNVVLRWEWRPGSTAYLVWQQDRFESRDAIDRVGPGGLAQALGAPGNNLLAVKISYWLTR